MAIVSISKAARLAKKSRTTIQNYIKQGKLSKCTDAQGAQGIDISELIRVFGNIDGHVGLQTADAHNGDHLAPIINKSVQRIEQENAALKREIELLKEVITEKDKRLLLLEDKTERQEEKPKKKWWKFS